MSQPVTVENDAVRLQVWPAFGGKVSSLVDKADDHELLFDYPAELPTRPRYDEPFDDGWCAGWDECFPAVAKGRYPGHPYGGIEVPDHGELWGLPTTAVPTKDGITCVWHGLRFGYRLTRKLHLDGPSIIADYALVNLAPFEFRFVHGQHVLLAMTTDAVVDFPAGTAWRYSHDGNGVDQNAPFDWPAVEPGLDLSHVTALPPGRGWKAFGVDAITSPVVVRYPTRGRSVTVGYHSSDGLPAHWGVWANTGGWGHTRNFTVEATTGRFDQLDRAIADGSAGRVNGGGRRDWSVRWTLGG